MIIEINRDKERVSLGLKQTKSNPWENIENKYPIGTHVKGKVVNLVPYGAFIEIEEGVEGLVHVTEMSWTKRITKPSELLRVGDDVEAPLLSYLCTGVSLIPSSPHGASPQICLSPNQCPASCVIVEDAASLNSLAKITTPSVDIKSGKPDSGLGGN